MWVLTFEAPPGLRSVSVLFALTGLTSFAENLVLTARFRSVERFVGGLDRLYVFHRRLAVVTTSVLVVHGALITASVVRDGTMTAIGWKILLGSIALAGLVAGVVSSFFTRMRHETFMWVQRALGVVFGLGAVHAIMLPGTLPVPAALRAYMIVVASVGGASFLYRSVLGWVAVPRTRYRVAECNRLDDDVVDVVLEPIGQPLRFRAGQFAFLSIVDGNVGREPHPYSIASAPDERRLRFMVKALGDYTRTIQHLQPGCEARVEGPYGTFWSAGANNPRQVWIGGGVGIAPFLSMARALDVGRQSIDLYYCTEGPEHAHFLTDLFDLADVNPRLRVVPIRKVSLGRITADDIEGVDRGIAGKEVFICGPPAMMWNLKEQFVALGAAPEQIHFEDFSFM